MPSVFCIYRCEINPKKRHYCSTSLTENKLFSAAVDLKLTPDIHPFSLDLTDNFGG